MNVRMMEGLLGASANVKLSDTSMSVYRQASAEGDTGKMEQAMKYTGACMEQASEYQKKLDKGMKDEAIAEREKAKLEQEAAIEKRREEHKKAESGMEQSQNQRVDTVQVREEARTAMADNSVGAGGQAGSDPVTYMETGAVVPSVRDEPAVSVSV